MGFILQDIWAHLKFLAITDIGRIADNEVKHATSGITCNHIRGTAGIAVCTGIRTLGKYHLLCLRGKYVTFKETGLRWSSIGIKNIL